MTPWRREVKQEAPALEAAPGCQLALQGVSKHFHTRQGKLHVLNEINLEVRRGEFLCILGPSGCGKSTLFSIIAGLEQPDTGQVLVEGVPVNGPGPDRVVVFQDGALFPWLTARGNVEFGLSMQNLPRAEARERAMEALEMVRLGKFADSYIHELSGGMRQRVAIARALAMQPKVLLMDEPFSALDAQTRNVLHEELQRIWTETGKTVVFVTHNVAEAVRLGDRIALLSFRPGSIKREIAITHPRPRLADDPHLIEIRSAILRSLKTDVQASVKEELGDDPAEDE